MNASKIGNVVTSCIDIVDTFDHQLVIARSSVSEARAVCDAVADRSATAKSKGSINLRIEERTRRLIDDAAAVRGKTRTEFMIDSARTQAIDVLLDQRLFVLDAAQYDSFVDALDNPPAPGPRLRALLRRTPAWAASDRS